MEKKKGGLAALIIEANPKLKGEKEEAPKEEKSDKELVAEEILSALNSGDASGLSESLSSFIKLCEYDEEESEPDGEAGKSEFEY